MINACKLCQDHLGEMEAKVTEERSKGEFELERLKKLLAEKESQLAKEREELNFIEQDKKSMIIEYDVSMAMIIKMVMWISIALVI